MNFEFQENNCTFTFVLVNNVLQITATQKETGKMWETWIMEPMVFTKKNISMSPEDMFEFTKSCRVSTGMSITFLADDIEISWTVVMCDADRKAVVLKPYPNSGCDLNVVLERLHKLSSALTSLEKDVNERIGKLEQECLSLKMEKLELADVTMERKVRADLLEFVGDTLLYDLYGNTKFDQVYLLFGIWYKAKYGKTSEYSIDQLTENFRCNGFLVKCGGYNVGAPWGQYSTYDKHKLKCPNGELGNVCVHYTNHQLLHYSLPKSDEKFGYK